MCDGVDGVTVVGDERGDGGLFCFAGKSMSTAGMAQQPRLPPALNHIMHSLSLCLSH